MRKKIFSSPVSFEKDPRINEDDHVYSLPTGKEQLIPHEIFSNDSSLVRAFHRHNAEDLLEFFFEHDRAFAMRERNQIQMQPDLIKKYFLLKGRDLSLLPEGKPDLSLCIELLSTGFELEVFSKLKALCFITRKERVFLDAFFGADSLFSKYYFLRNRLSKPYSEKKYLNEKLWTARRKRFYEVKDRLVIGDTELSGTGHDFIEEYVSDDSKFEELYPGLQLFKFIRGFFEEGDYYEINSSMEAFIKFFDQLPEPEIEKITDQLIKYLHNAEEKSNDKVDFFNGYKFIRLVSRKYPFLAEKLADNLRADIKISGYSYKLLRNLGYFGVLIESDPSFADNDIIEALKTITGTVRNGKREKVYTYINYPALLFNALLDRKPEVITERMVSYMFLSLVKSGPRDIDGIKCVRKVYEKLPDLALKNIYRPAVVKTLTGWVWEVIVPRQKEICECLRVISVMSPVDRNSIIKLLYGYLVHEKDFYREGSAACFKYMIPYLPEILDENLVEMLFESLKDKYWSVVNESALALRETAKYRPDLIQLGYHVYIYEALNNFRGENIVAENMMLIIAECVKNKEIPVNLRLNYFSRIFAHMRKFNSISFEEPSMGIEIKAAYAALGYINEAFMAMVDECSPESEESIAQMIEGFFLDKLLADYSMVKDEIVETCFEALYSIAEADFKAINTEVMLWCFDHSNRSYKGLHRVIALITEKKPDFVPRKVLNNIIGADTIEPEMIPSLCALYKAKPGWRKDIREGLLKMLELTDNTREMILAYTEMLKVVPEIVNEEVLHYMEQRLEEKWLFYPVEFYSALLDVSPEKIDAARLLVRLIKLEEDQKEQEVTDLIAKVLKVKGYNTDIVEKCRSYISDNGLKDSDIDLLMDYAAFLNSVKDPEIISSFQNRFRSLQTADEKRDFIKAAGKGFDVNVNAYITLKEIIIDNLYYNFDFYSGKTFLIRYPGEYLSDEQKAMINDYFYFLRSTFPESKFRLISSRCEDDSPGTAIFRVECYDSSDTDLPTGKSRIDISLSSGEIKDYPLDIVSLLNYSITVSSIPDTEGSKKYRYADYVEMFVFAKNQYEKITGDLFPGLIRGIEDTRKKLQQIFIKLPPAEEFPVEYLRVYYKAGRSTLMNA